MKEKFKKQLLIDVLTVVVGYVALSLLMRFGVINDYVKGILLMACINIILTVSLNITSGFLGELALGHAGFMAVGAYAAALFSKSLSLIPAVEFPLAILVGGFAALIAGYIVSIPALRLKGDYLAIITLAAGEIIRNILKNLDIVGGTKGYTGIPGYTNFAWAYFVAVICIFASKSLIQSRHGRSIISIREDEIAAEASGVDTNRYKIIGFIFSAFFAGVGGALYAHYLRFLQPGIFTLNKSIEILVMVVLGGMGSIRGSIISAVILTVLPEMLRGFSDYRMLVYSLALIFMMLAKHSEKIRQLLAGFRPAVKRKETAHE
ncbi:MAG: branched-chain amino acid ABC transporter permease [Erysipelotrichaceae bacterium]|nr:branched-chain amino acid ABC transporter permease [Erysipelotrichaceae bacterium]